MRIGGDVAVGIDAGGLHAPIPDVAIDIIGERRRFTDKAEPQEHADAEDDPKCCAQRSPLPNERRAREAENGLRSSQPEKRINLERGDLWLRQE